MRILNRIIKKLLATQGIECGRVPDKNRNYSGLTREDFFRLYFSSHASPNFYFLQVGASDGRYGDPIYPFVSKYKLSGTVVEPLPDIYKKLQGSHENNPNVQCVNAGISKMPMPFYTIDPSISSKIAEEDYLRLTGIASFDKALFKTRLSQVLPKIITDKNLTDEDIESYIATLEVPTMELQELIEKQNIERIDFLFFDCQGKDFEILKSFDIERFTPSLINFESIHLSEQDKKESQEYLSSKGYHVFMYGNDTCAYKLK